MVSDVTYGDGNERILGGQVSVVRATREPCFVCGHPTGDCTTDGSAPHVVVGANVFPSLQQDEIHIVEEDIWEERPITPFTTTRVLLAAKGTAMPLQKAKELGLV